LGQEILETVVDQMYRHYLDLKMSPLQIFYRNQIQYRITLSLLSSHTLQIGRTGAYPSRNPKNQSYFIIAVAVRYHFAKTDKLIYFEKMFYTTA